MARTSDEEDRTLRIPSWTTVAPIVAAVCLVLVWGRVPNTALAVVIAVVLGAAVIGAVHHAEIVASRVGEPYGSLILAVSVTVIEVALIVTLMISGGPETSSLARDTVFAAAMITMNGIVGISLWIGARRFGLAHFNAEGSGAALATVVALAGLTLVLPAFTASRQGPQFSPAQLAFAALASLALYAMFVMTQTGRNREFFVPVELTTSEKKKRKPGEISIKSKNPEHSRPTKRDAGISLALLLVCLVAVVGLAKVESPAIESAVAAIGFPPTFVGVVIALLVLLPESLAAVRAARRDQVQISLNLAYGSAMASIGLTIPAIAVASIWLEGSLVLGLGPTQMVLLALSAFVGALTVVSGRATRQQGGVHLILFLAFIFLSIYP